MLSEILNVIPELVAMVEKSEGMHITILNGKMALEIVFTSDLCQINKELEKSQFF